MFGNVLLTLSALIYLYSNLGFMTDSASFFDMTAQPCDDAELEELQRTIHRTLPASYAELIKQTGGGTLSIKHSYLTVDHVDDEPEPVNISVIYGHGEMSDGDDNDLLTCGQELSHEWEIPRKSYPSAQQKPECPTA